MERGLVELPEGRETPYRKSKIVYDAHFSDREQPFHSMVSTRFA